MIMQARKALIPLVAVLLLALSWTTAFRVKHATVQHLITYRRDYSSFSSHRLYMANDAESLTNTTPVEATLTPLEIVTEEIKKYSIQIELPSDELSKIFTLYSNEMAKRKVQMKGFRPGRMPPSAKRDVCRFVVDYGVEQSLNNLCIKEGLRLFHDSSCEEPLSTDFNRIVPINTEGKKYSERRDVWNLGEGFSFYGEVYAKKS